jgi:16S rRNA (cytosine1402-N4)-methyltransferase
LTEVLEHLAPERGGVFIDCTVASGGMRERCSRLEHRGYRTGPRSIGVGALARSLAAFAGQVELVHGDYRELTGVLDARGIGGVDGVLADLGVSSLQLDAPGRGFSFRRDDGLDMRMDTSQGQTAAAMLATADEQTLADVIYPVRRRASRSRGGARDSGGAIPGADHHDGAVCRHRAPGDSTEGVLTDRSGDAHVSGHPHLGESRARRAGRFPGAGRRPAERRGRLAVITFHSLEDRIVKHTFRALQAEGLVTIRTKRPVVPTPGEVASNARARSAKLRAIEKAYG